MSGWSEHTLDRLEDSITQENATFKCAKIMHLQGKKSFEGGC